MRIHARTRKHTHTHTCVDIRNCMYIYEHTNTCCLGAKRHCVMNNSINQLLCQCLLRAILSVSAGCSSSMDKADLADYMICQWESRQWKSTRTGESATSMPVLTLMIFKGRNTPLLVWWEELWPNLKSFNAYKPIKSPTYNTALGWWKSLIRNVKETNWS